MTTGRSPVLGTVPHGGPGGCFIASSPQGMVHRGTTAKVLLGILVTELLRLSLFIYFQDRQSGEREAGSVLSQLLPFTASTMAPRTMMSVCSASV